MLQNYNVRKPRQKYYSHSPAYMFKAKHMKIYVTMHVHRRA